MYLPLQFYLPEPKPARPDPFAPLGISFEPEVPVEKISLDALDLDNDISWLKAHLPVHPLIGAVVSSAPDPPGTDVPTRRSVGGGRAADIATQFEVQDEAMDAYPASVASVETYLDQLAADEQLEDLRQ